MNKGIDKATGRWINFMNAGDLFYSNIATEQMLSSFHDIDKYPIIHGDAEFRLKNIAYISRAGEESTIDRLMHFSHQALFVRSHVAKKHKFTLT